MNDTLKYIKERFSCRDFSEEIPSDEQMNAIVQSAIQAPSGMNRQLWHVIVVENADLIADMEKEGMIALEKMNPDMYQRILSRGSSLFYNAPRMIVFAIKKAYPEGAELIDLGILAQNTVIAATSLGLATLHCGFVGLAFAGEKALEFKERLSFPEGYDCGMGVLIGYAKSTRLPHEPDNTKITYVK